MQIILLFDSIYSAQEVAYTLQASWDGCNAITLIEFDECDISFQTAVEIVSAEYCIVGQKCLIQDVESLSNSPTSPISFGQTWSRVGCKVILVSQDPDLVDKELLKALTNRMLLTDLIYPDLSNTQKLLSPASVGENDINSEI